ncbi:DNA translocase FtsK 4TM domain-containing protein, partial [Alistipes putredinis]
MATKKNSSAKSPQATSRSNRDSMRWILGLLLLFAGLFLTASVLFYYFDWRADMSLVSGVEQEDPRLADLSDAIENPCGYAGAWLAERLVGRSFGLFGIILPLIVTMVGVRIIRQRPLLFNHSVLGALLILILGSLTLGFAFGEKWAVLTVLMKLRLMNTPVRIQAPSNRMIFPSTPITLVSLRATSTPKAPPHPLPKTAH